MGGQFRFLAPWRAHRQAKDFDPPPLRFECVHSPALRRVSSCTGESALNNPNRSIRLAHGLGRISAASDCLAQRREDCLKRELSNWTRTPGWHTLSDRMRPWQQRSPANSTATVSQRWKPASREDLHFLRHLENQRVPARAAFYPQVLSGRSL